MIRLTLTACLVLALAGCVGNPGAIAPRGQITLQQAMADVGRGFGEMKAAADKTPGVVLDIYPCEVTVDFSVQAAATAQGGVNLALSGKPSIGVTPSAGVSASNSATGSRGNTVSVTMESRACLLRDILAAQGGKGGGKSGQGAPQSAGPSIQNIVNGFGPNFATTY